MTVAEALDLNRKFRERRRRWQWKIGRPYSEDIDAPPPGVLDDEDAEDG